VGGLRTQNPDRARRLRALRRARTAGDNLKNAR
jgi:hypothetical protein